LTTFENLDLIEPLLRAVAEEGYSTPTPIQEQAIPPLLDGRDVLGCAQTGTGKTAAFSLPIIQFIAERNAGGGKPPIRALCLTPTRELAAQIGASLKAYSQFTNVRHTVIFGGVSQRPQVAALQRGVDVLVATPGRLLDLHGQGFIDFSSVEFFVLDEADRMLDMGFIRDIRRILKLLPSDRQNLLFSATLPPAIVKLASFLREPVRVEVTPAHSTVELIEQRVMFVERRNKRRLLVQVLKRPEVESVIVFTRTKHGANRVVKELTRARLNAVAIHGNKSQNARERALEGFKAGKVMALVATDIASRGLDIDDVSHVVNFDLPNEPESYVHRIGRTGRAGRTGIAISFCDETESDYLRDIIRLTGEDVPEDSDHEYHFPEARPENNASAARRIRTELRERNRQNRPPRRPKGERGGQSRGSGGRNQRDSDKRRSGDSSDNQGRSNNSSENQGGENANSQSRRRRRAGAGVPLPNRNGQQGQNQGNSSGAGSEQPRPPRRRRRRRRPGVKPKP